MNKATLRFLITMVALGVVSGCQKKNIPAASVSNEPTVVVSENNLNKVPALEPALAPEPSLNGEVFTFVEQMPEFPGGQASLMQFLIDNIRYPSEALANKEEGRAYVQFIVMDDGLVTGARILKSVSSAIDQEALRVVKLMPRWTPGKQNGLPVHVRYTLPIVFATK